MGKNTRKKAEVTQRGARERRKPTGLFLWQEWAVGDTPRENTAEGNHLHCCTDTSWNFPVLKRMRVPRKVFLREKLAL